MLIKRPSGEFHALESRVRVTLQEYNMIAPGDQILVAVSGGPDSTALLHCLHRLSPEFHLKLTVAHLNHRIRGEEADADEAFVRQISLDLQIPFISETIEVKKHAVEFKQNLEEMARRMRYGFLRKTANRIGAQKIAVGHNLNDQAETALFRFLRGTGIEGLSAIHPVVDGLIIRPLLECPRDLICDYLKSRNAGCREDSTNTDLKYARNRIRQELNPYLQNHFNPKLIPTLAREALLAREAWSFIEMHSTNAYKALSARKTDGISLKISDLLELHPTLQKEVLRKALKECLGSIHGVNAAHIQSVLSLCRRNGGEQTPIPHGGIAVRQFDELTLMQKKPQQTVSYAYSLDLPGECVVAEARLEIRCAILKNSEVSIGMNDPRSRAVLEPSVLPQSLTIRSRVPGDRYGGPGHRKVKKMLIDHKIPRLERSSLPMIAAGNDVIWIPGFRPAHGYEARETSAECVLIELTQHAE
jgi:tRNA(Ile)-lysidine synthase